MNAPRQPEVWLRGPVPGIPPLLQPVAHSLLQCREELQATLGRLTPEQISARPFGAASIEFHVRHAMGSLDRLFTYARGGSLTPDQQAAIATEGQPHPDSGTADNLLSMFSDAIDRALAQLRATSESTLLEPRGVGRAQLPSTVLGLLFHAAEHTQRHVGQAVTTATSVGGRGEQG